MSFSFININEYWIHNLLASFWIPLIALLNISVWKFNAALFRRELNLLWRYLLDRLILMQISEHEYSRSALRRPPLNTRRRLNWPTFSVLISKIEKENENRRYRRRGWFCQLRELKRKLTLLNFQKDEY